jgi:tetratricopeptide (TPR) repeat protein
MLNPKFPVLSAVLLLTLATQSLSAADFDSVLRRSTGKVVGGEIKSITKNEIVVATTLGGKEEKIPANDVLGIEFKADPLGLSLARSNERGGNLSQALTGYQEALASGPTGFVKAEISFLIARVSAKIALADQSQAPAAITKLKVFLDENRDNFRFYEAHLLMAEISLLTGDSSTAEQSYALVEQAPWEDIKMAGKIGTARGLIARNDFGGARAILDAVAAVNPTNEQERARKFEAILGQAECLKGQNQLDEAISSLQQVIDGVTADDTRLLAEAYLRQGDCLTMKGDNPKEALMAYLRIDVIPTLSAHSDLHAQALYQLNKLWTVVGQPERSTEAAVRLEQEYPNSPWTKKLQAGS